MKRYTCRCCGFESLIDPGERCPGCGHLFSYMNHQPQWTQRALEKAQEEVEIRRLRCALMRQDDLNDGVMMECTITNRSLKLHPCGFLRKGKELKWPSGVKSPFDITLPYKMLTKISQGTHMGQRARFYTYHHKIIGPLNLWFFMDRSAAARCGDIDREIAQTVGRFLDAGEISEAQTACAKQ